MESIYFPMQKVEKIRPNLRLIYEYEAIEAVCHFIQKGGEIEPLLVWFDGENFRIWDGEKRWRACKKARLLKERYISPTPVCQYLPAMTQKPGKVKVSRKSCRSTSVL